MGRKKKPKQTAVDKTWEQIRKIYIFGQFDTAKNELVYPSQRQLAKQFDVKPGTISAKAYREKWHDEREQKKEEIKLATRSEVEQRIVRSMAELQAEDLVILDSLIERYAQRLVSGHVLVTTPDALKAMSQRIKIYESILGIDKASELQQHNTQVNVNGDVNLRNMSDEDEQRLMDSLAGNRSRRAAVTDEALKSATEADYVPQLD